MHRAAIAVKTVAEVFAFCIERLKVMWDRLGAYLRIMFVERTSKEIIIRLPASMDADDLQEFLDYTRNKELTKGYKMPQKVVDNLAADVARE